MLNNLLIQYQTVLSSLLYNTQIMQCLNTEGIGYFDQYLMFENTLEPTIDSIVEVLIPTSWWLRFIQIMKP